MKPIDDAIVAEAVRRLREALSPIAIYHFGSSSRGQAGPDSDLDLLVVVRSSPLRFAERCVIGYRAL